MQVFLIVAVTAFIAPSLSQIACAADDFYGIVESRPDGGVGTWIVDGFFVEVTDDTNLDDDHGPLEVGACVEVKLDDDVTDRDFPEEIESGPLENCGN